MKSSCMVNHICSHSFPLEMMCRALRNRRWSQAIIFLIRKVYVTTKVEYKKKMKTMQQVQSSQQNHLKANQDAPAGGFPVTTTATHHSSGSLAGRRKSWLPEALPFGWGHSPRKLAGETRLPHSTPLRLHAFSRL